MAEVFISFIHEEERIAKAVHRFLKKKLEKNVFLSSDKWQVFAGELWLDRIRQELSSAKVVILLISHKSVLRPWVNFEAGAAWLTNKAVIPVCFADMSKEELPKPYSGIQAVSLRTEAYYLLTSVAHHLQILSPYLRYKAKTKRLGSCGPRWIRFRTTNREVKQRRITLDAAERAQGSSYEKVLYARAR